MKCDNFLIKENIVYLYHNKNVKYIINLNNINYLKIINNSIYIGVNEEEIEVILKEKTEFILQIQTFLKFIKISLSKQNIYLNKNNIDYIEKVDSVTNKLIYLINFKNNVMNLEMNQNESLNF